MYTSRNNNNNINNSVFTCLCCIVFYCQMTAYRKGRNFLIYNKNIFMLDGRKYEIFTEIILNV